MGGALPCKPTIDMRKELELDGEGEFNEDDLNKMSRKMSKWIEEYRYQQNLPKSHSWFNLFKEIDNDSSGFVTFDELQTCVRQELKKTQKTVPLKELRKLWCALDTNNDNRLDKDEMAKFFKRGTPEAAQKKS